MHNTTSPTYPVSDHVLVIGAGPAGIVTGYFLQQRGVPYQIVDRASVVASTWEGLYDSLKLNTSRWFSHMPGMPFPRHYAVLPTGREYYDYVLKFVKAHRLNIQLGVDITGVKRCESGWLVESSQGNVIHPAVVIATGRYTHPYYPDIPGIETFPGQKIHAHDYHAPETFKGQRVMVVGNGPSGLDIALDIGQQNGAVCPALLSMRTGVLLRRRYPLGLHKHTWMLLLKPLPEALRNSILDKLERMTYRRGSLAGIKTIPPGQASTAAAARGPELIHAVQKGQVICVDAPVHVSGSDITLSDGTTRTVDALILATGYRPKLDFIADLPPEVDSEGWPMRWNSQNYFPDEHQLTYRGTYDVGQQTDAKFQPHDREIAGMAGLFQVGLYYKGKGTMYNINVEAEIAAAQLDRYLASVREHKYNAPRLAT
jgi:cation diffusion facilitator CzcD-associated flavoprotein CzcO